ncbi:MAG: signal peptidase I [Desulfovibrionaceae bacterium]|nr:signal peptidase I [Desulfovibrionaceae bacterium]
MINKKVIEYIEAIIVALVIAIVVRTFVVQPFSIPSESMLNTLIKGDCVMVNKFIYGIKIPFTNDYLVELEAPQRGDVVVFEFPRNPSIDYIKRIVGLPGDTIAVHNKQLYVNGSRVDEPYAIHIYPDMQLPQDNFGPITVPEGEYFMMGDNRDDSADSRAWGTVKRNAIIGKAWRLYWSWGSISDVRWDRIGKKIE